MVPGLTVKERNFLGPIVLGSSVLFYIGVAFSYAVLTPAALNFFVSYADGAVESIWSIDQYFEFVLVLMFSTGLAFQVISGDDGYSSHCIREREGLIRHEQSVLNHLPADLFLNPGASCTGFAGPNRPDLQPAVLFCLEVCDRGLSHCRCSLDTVDRPADPDIARSSAHCSLFWGSCYSQAAWKMKISSSLSYSDSVYMYVCMYARVPSRVIALKKKKKVYYYSVYWTMLTSYRENNIYCWILILCKYVSYRVK